MAQDWGYVYEAMTTSFIRRNWSKIGYTNNIENRMRQLSSGAGQPEKFSSHNYYRFETVDQAKEVEKYVHKELTDLGLRVNDRREFFERKYFIGNIVVEAANEFGYKTLSNFQLQRDCFPNIGLFLPCRFFLLHDDRVFEDFCYWGMKTIEALYPISKLNNDTSILSIPWMKYFDYPEYPWKDYLRDFDKEPYLLARMKSSNDEFIVSAAETYKEIIQDDLEDYFDFDKNWCHYS